MVPDAALHFPLTGVDTLFYQLHASGVGFGYLINTDVSFSLWFFYLLKKAMNVWGVTQGWRQPGRGGAGTRRSFRTPGIKGTGPGLLWG